MLKITKICNDSRNVIKSIILNRPGASINFPINLKSVLGFQNILIAKTTPYSTTASRMIACVAINQDSIALNPENYEMRSDLYRRDEKFS